MSGSKTPGLITNEAPGYRWATKPVNSCTAACRPVATGVSTALWSLSRRAEPPRCARKRTPRAAFPRLGSKPNGSAARCRAATAGDEVLAAPAERRRGRCPHNTETQQQRGAHRASKHQSSHAETSPHCTALKRHRSIDVVQRHHPSRCCFPQPVATRTVVPLRSSTCSWYGPAGACCRQ